MSTELLPDPSLIASLSQLAGSRDPDVYEQATELCRVLPLPLRLRAAEQLVRQGAVEGAARCIWPDTPEEQCSFLRAVARELATGLRPLWLAHSPQDRRLDALLEAVEERDASGVAPSRLRALQGALSGQRAGRSPASIAAAAVAALCDADAERAVQQVMRAIVLVTRDPTAPARQATAFLRRDLRQRRLVDAPTRRALAAAFAAAVDRRDVGRASLLLDAGCASHSQEDVVYGVDDVCASLLEAAAEVQARFPGAWAESTVSGEDREQVTLEVRDHLPMRGAVHVFASRQVLYFNELGYIWRIEHQALDGEVQALRAAVHRRT